MSKSSPIFERSWLCAGQIPMGNSRHGQSSLNAPGTIGVETTAPAFRTATTSSVSIPVTPKPSAGPTGGAVRMSSDEVLSLIEKVADLHAKGILTDAEFEAKKAELLSRL